jgi:hypothetical protein
MSINQTEKAVVRRIVNKDFDEADVHLGVDWVHVEFGRENGLEPYIDAEFAVLDDGVVCKNGMVMTPRGQFEMMAEPELVEAMEETL